MAQPTTATPGAPPAMAPTPGITPHAGTAPVGDLQHAGNRRQGTGHPSMADPNDPNAPTLDPILFSDLEPVHFVRLYPEAASKGGGAAAEAAMAAGQALAKPATPLIASQQEKVVYEGQEAPAPTAHG